MTNGTHVIRHSPRLPLAARAAIREPCRHVRRFLRSPAFAHGVFAARRGGAHPGVDGESEGAGDAGGGDYGSRESVRGDRVFPRGEEGGGEADHRVRGVYGGGFAPGSRDGEWAGHGVSFHAAGEGQRGLCEPREAGVGGASGRDVLQAADRSRIAGATFGGADRAERVPERRGKLGADH